MCTGHERPGSGLTIYDHDPSVNSGVDKSRQYYLFSSESAKEGTDQVVVKTNVKSLGKAIKKSTSSHQEFEESMI